MKEPCFVLNNNYEKSYIESLDLVEFNKVKEIDALIYIGTKKVYFFEKITDEKLKLYSILNKSSFYLN